MTGEREKKGRLGKRSGLGRKAAFLSVCLSASSVFMLDRKMEAGAQLGFVTEQQLRDGGERMGRIRPV